jgi:hypothetical protein
MTPKTMKSSRNQTNRAQMERRIQAEHKRSAQPKRSADLPSASLISSEGVGALKATGGAPFGVTVSMPGNS